MQRNCTSVTIYSQVNTYRIVINQKNEEKPLNIEHVEKEHRERVLTIFKGNRTKSAQAIGWFYNTLNNKVKQ
jgi:DNA-binding protein Fis